MPRRPSLTYVTSVHTETSQPPMGDASRRPLDLVVSKSGGGKREGMPQNDCTVRRQQCLMQLKRWWSASRVLLGAVGTPGVKRPWMFRLSGPNAHSIHCRSGPDRLLLRRNFPKADRYIAHRYTYTETHLHVFILVLQAPYRFLPHPPAANLLSSFTADIIPYNRR